MPHRAPVRRRVASGASVVPRATEPNCPAARGQGPTANLRRKGDVFVVRFRYLGREYKKSLKVRDPKAAAAARNVVEVTIHRLLTGQIRVPAEIDPGDFIVSGGTLARPAAPKAAAPAITQVVADYLQ